MLVLELEQSKQQITREADDGVTLYDGQRDIEIGHVANPDRVADKGLDEWIVHQIVDDERMTAELRYLHLGGRALLRCSQFSH